MPLLRREPHPDRFSLGPTSGSASGWIGIVFAAVVVVIALVHGVTADEWRVIACMCLLAAACWTLMLRPRVVFDTDVLVLRNMLSDVHVPYPCVRSVTVRSMTRVTATDGRCYLGLAVGRSRSEMAGPRNLDRRGFLERRIGSQLGADRAPARAVEEKIPDLVERLAAERAARASPAGAEAGVRRLVAVPEVAALSLTIAGVVAAFTV